MNKRYIITLLVAGAGFLSACNSGGIRRNPGKIYVPDMTYSRAYDAYTANPVTADGQTSQPPVPGTIARGQALPDRYTEADTALYAAMKYPEWFTSDFSQGDLDEGKRLYNIYCGICHGDKLDGNGPIYANGKFAAMPANLVGGDYYKYMKPGTIYHAIKYGKNMMGSYAAQLDEARRWQVIAYIKSFQADKGGDAFTLLKGGEQKAQPEAAPTTDTAGTAAVN